LLTQPLKALHKLVSKGPGVVLFCITPIKKMVLLRGRISCDCSGGLVVRIRVKYFAEDFLGASRAEYRGGVARPVKRTEGSGSTSLRGYYPEPEYDAVGIVVSLVPSTILISSGVRP
jgi:hypothetical protein